MAKARAPLADEKLVVFFDDPANFVKLMLLESFIPAQANRLQPEFTGMATFFNVNVRWLEFIREIKMKPVTILS